MEEVMFIGDRVSVFDQLSYLPSSLLFVIFSVSFLSCMCVSVCVCVHVPSVYPVLSVWVFSLSFLFHLCECSSLHSFISRVIYFYELHKP